MFECGNAFNQCHVLPEHISNLNVQDKFGNAVTPSNKERMFCFEIQKEHQTNSINIVMRKPWFSVTFDRNFGIFEPVTNVSDKPVQCYLCQWKSMRNWLYQRFPAVLVTLLSMLLETKPMDLWMEWWEMATRRLVCLTCHNSWMLPNTNTLQYLKRKSAMIIMLRSTAQTKITGF